MDIRSVSNIKVFHNNEFFMNSHNWEKKDMEKIHTQSPDFSTSLNNRNYSPVKIFSSK